MADIVKKTIQTRIAQKHDVEENWNKAENFIPKKGEIIIYDKDDNHVTIRVKVGDGVTVVKSLPFITDNYYTITEINSKLDGKQDKLEPGVNLLGTDGITIDKAADSENIEVSGKNLIKDPYPGVNNTGANIVNYKPYGSADWGSAFVRNTHSLVNNAEAGAIVGYDNGGVIYAKTTSDDPWSVVNKEYAEENFRKVVTGSASEIKVYTTKYGDTQSWMFLNSDPDGAPGAEIPQYGTGGTLRANMPEIVLDNSVVNRKYADDNYVKKNPANDKFVYGKGIVESTLQETVYYVDQGNFSQVGRIPCWIAPDASHTLASVNNPVTAKVSTPVGEADIANKKYVDDTLVNIPLKTLFGNQDIHGTGNIDLYRHNIHISAGISGFGAEIYFTYYSSNNLQVDSLTDLKTLMGNEFEEGVSGLTSTQIPVIKITQAGFTAGTSEYTWASMESTTFTDTVTTI